MQAKIKNHLHYSSLIVALLTLTISSFFAVMMYQGYISREENQAKQIAHIQADKIQRVIENKLSITKSIEALIKVNPDQSIDEIERPLIDLLNGFPVASISLAPGGVITHTYPIEGNEATIGHDIINDPARATESNEALYSKKLTLSGPYELRQDGFGIIGRLPIFLHDDSFWGFACAVLKFPEALQDAGLDSLEEQGYSYELWRINPDTNEKQIIQTSTEELNTAAQTHSFILPNSTWSLSIALADGWLNYSLLLIYIIIVMSFTILVTSLHYVFRKLVNSRNELQNSIAQQSKNYQKMFELNERLRIFRHDMKNHMLSISTLLSTNKVDDAQEYIKKIDETFISTIQIKNTENYVLDALISEKRELALQKNIDINIQIDITRKLNLANIECSALIGNLFDNALEACENAKQDKPFIHAKLYCKGNLFYIRCSNSTFTKPKVVNGHFVTSKDDHIVHGYGMRNIQMIVKKYHGTIDYTYEDHVFTLSLMLIDS